MEGDSSMKIVFRLVKGINQAMFYVVGAAIVTLSLFVFYDVIARYFFSRPTNFGFDLSIWLTGFAAFLSGGYCLLHKEHIRVDIFYAKLSPRAKSLVDIFTGILLLLIVIALVWFGGARVWQLYQMGSVASTGFNIPLWIKWSIVPLGGILLGLQGIINLINDIYHVAVGKRLEEETK